MMGMPTGVVPTTPEFAFWNVLASRRAVSLWSRIRSLSVNPVSFTGARREQAPGQNKIVRVAMGVACCPLSTSPPEDFEENVTAPVIAGSTARQARLYPGEHQERYPAPTDFLATGQA